MRNPAYAKASAGETNYSHFKRTSSAETSRKIKMPKNKKPACAKSFGW
jgi:hypothetical protein